MEIVGPYLPAIVLAVICIAMLVYQIAIGHGQQIADTALAFLLNQANATLASVKREDLDLAVAFLYNAAPGLIGPIPWKQFASLGNVQALAWLAWERAVDFADGPVGTEAKRAIRAQRAVRGQ